MKVFWSWQNDLPPKVSRDFVKSALKDAVEAVATELLLTEAERLDLDHDTKDEPGLVEIVATIFKKIDASSAFVADVTPVATAESGKLVPNPNVMMELGYALKTLGYEHILLVANKAYGGTPETLPFDLRHRRGPIYFDLPPAASAQVIAQEKKRLTKQLTEALKLNLSTSLERQDASVEPQLYPAVEGNPAVWLSEDQTIEHHDFFQDGGQPRAWKVSDVSPKAYMRICPAPWPKNRPSRKEVQDVSEQVRLRAFGQWIHGDGGANGLGVVAVGFGLQPQGIAHAVTQWFVETGEIWGFNARVAMNENGRTLLSDYRVLTDWRAFLARSVNLLAELHAPLPYYVEAGVAGLDDVYWAGRGPAKALERNVSFFLKARDWNDDVQVRFLTSAINALRDAFNQPRVTEAELTNG